MICSQLLLICRLFTSVCRASDDSDGLNSQTMEGILNFRMNLDADFVHDYRWFGNAIYSENNLKTKFIIDPTEELLMIQAEALVDWFSFHWTHSGCLQRPTDYLHTYQALDGDRADDARFGQVMIGHRDSLFEPNCLRWTLCRFRNLRSVLDASK